MKAILLAIGLMSMITGCGTSPYFQAGLGYQLDGMTDYMLRTDRDWTCDDNWTGNFEAGLEFDNQWTAGYRHISYVTCGGPFNSKPEVYMDEIIISKKWGGKR